MSRHITMKLHHNRNKEKILQAFREKRGHIRIKKKQLLTFHTATLQTRFLPSSSIKSAGNNTFRLTVNLELILYLARLLTKYSNMMKLARSPKNSKSYPLFFKKTRGDVLLSKDKQMKNKAE